MQRHESEACNNSCRCSSIHSAERSEPGPRSARADDRVGPSRPADAGAEGLTALIEAVCVVNSFSRDDEQLPDQLGRALGIRPKQVIYSLIGGNTPQMLLNQFSRDIATGRQAPGSRLEKPGDAQGLV
jgi:hypothetical protein